MAGNPYQRGGVSGAPVSGVAVSGGDFTSDSISAVLDITQGADTVSAAGTVAIAAAAAITQGGDTTASASTLALVGAVGVTQGADTISATGGAPPVTADLAVTQGADSTASAGVLTISATISSFRRLVGVSGYAVSSMPVSGDYEQSLPGDVVQAGDTVSATATLAIAAAAAITQGADTVTTPATLLITASAGMTQGANTMSAATTRTMRRRLIASSYGGGSKWGIAA